MKQFFCSALRLIKNVLINSLLLAFSCMVSLLVLEQGFRLWVFGWSAFDKQAMEKNTMIGNSGLVMRSPHPEIYWALKPNLDVNFKFARLQTNSFGMADQEYPLAKPAGVYRVAVLGDSYSQASGVDTDKSYHALLETRLNAQALQTNSENSYQFLNFALGGFNLQRYNEVLKYLVPQWQPDALLIGYCGMNDHEQIQIHTTAQPFDPFPFNGFYRSYVRMYLQNMHFSVEAQAQPLIDEEAAAFINGEFARIRQQADAMRTEMPVLLAYLDNRQRHPADKEILAELAAQHQLVFVDASAPFNNSELDKYSLHIFDSHPNARANEIFADILQAAIVNQNLFNASALTPP